MFWEIVLIIIGLLYYANQQAKRKAKMQKCIDEGRFIKSDEKTETQLFHDYCYDFQFGNKECIPKEYHDYLYLNRRALYDYCLAKAKDEMWRKGFRPYLCDVMPKPGWDAFEKFHQDYDEKIKLMNETGQFRL